MKETGRIALRAFAKINLTLEVLGERPDGYHELRTVMHSIGLSDTVTVTVEPYSGPDRYIRVRASEPLPFRNTARRAAEAYFEAADRLCPELTDGLAVSIELQKGIPSEAGLGGASADGAAVLYAMEKLIGALGTDKLYEIAPAVGADVPFCLHGGTCRCEGVGEILTPFALGRRLWFVIAKPNEGVSTRELFSRLPLPRPRVQTMQAMAALGKGDLNALAPLVKNVLEPAAIELVPEIGVLKQKLLDAGALAAQMTGSGSAVFGLFESEEAANAALPAVSDAAFSTVCYSL